MDLTDLQMQIVLMVQGLAGVGEATTEMDNLAVASDRVTTSGEAVYRGLAGQGTIFGAFGANLAKVERSYDAIFRAGMHMVILGQQLNQVWQSGAGIVKDSITKYQEFQTQLVTTANAIGGIQVGSTMFNALAAGIEKASVAIGVFNPVQVAQGLYYWEGATGAVIRTNSDLTKNLGDLMPLLEMAYMRHIDLKAAIYGVEGSMRMFGMDISQTGSVTAFFTDLVAKNALEMSDLIGAMSQVGPVAKQYHMDIYDTATALAALADNGLRGTRAGMVLRQELIKIGDPTSKATKALNALFLANKNLGKSYMDIIFPNGKFIGFTGYIKDMAIATQGLTDKQKAQLFGTIGTAREMSGLIATIDSYQRSMDSAGNKTGAVVSSQQQAALDFAAAWSNVQKTWDYLSNSFQNSLLPIFYAIGQNAMELLAPILAMATQFLKLADAWIIANPEAVKFLEKIAAIGLIVVGVLATFFTFTGTLLLLAAGFGVVAQGMGLVILVGAGLVAAVALIAVAFATNFMGIRDKVGAVIGEIARRVAPFVAMFVNGFQHIAHTVTDTINTWAPVFAYWVNKIWNDAKPLLAQLGQLWDSVFNKQIVPAVQSLINAVEDLVSQAAPVIAQFVALTMRLIDDLLPVFKGAADFGIRFLGNAFMWLADTVTHMMNAIWQIIKSVIDVVSAIFQTFIDMFEGHWEKVGLDVGRIIGALGGVIVAVLSGAFNTIVAAIKGALGIISTVIETVFGTKPGSVYAFILSGINKVLDFMGGVPKAIGDALNAGLHFLTDAGSSIASTVLSAIQSALNWVGGVPNALVDIGKNIVKGLWNGILSLKDWLINQLTSWVDSVIPGPIRNALGMKSPSRVMAVLGTYIVQGLAMGINSDTSAIRAMQAHTQSLVRVAKQGFMDAQTALSGDHSTAFTYSTSGTRTIHIQLDVTSSDGSVDQLKASDISNALNGSDLVKALQHMASVT